MRDILSDAEGAVERGDIGPGKANRGRDKPSFPKRFYKAVQVFELEGNFLIQLDGRPVRTPGRNELALPTKAAAEIIAAEWQAVENEINPLLMPATRLANTAVDGVAGEAQAVLEDILRYTGSDMLCYRADTPEGLVANQRKHWDPLLDWAADEIGARFETNDGIMHIAQPKAAIAAFGRQLERHDDPFVLAAIHTFTSLSGSAIIALALAEGYLTAEAAWQAAHVDEDWNISLWGEDYEAAERRAKRWVDFAAADALMRAVKSAGIARTNE